MRAKTRTPWTHESELAMVRDMIFPQHVPVDLYAPPAEARPDERASAVSKIVGWSWKVTLPWPLSATMELVTAQLFDEEARGDLLSSDINKPLVSNLAGNFAIRSTFSTAFSRFVNGFVDKDVTGAGESSMFANAAKIGLPVHFVEFRHKVTHGREMPGSVELRNMNREALDWLYTTWWKVNATGDPGRALWEVEERATELEEAARRIREDRNERRGLPDQQEAEAVGRS